MNIHEQVESRVQATSREIERRYGKGVSKIVDRMIGELLASALAEAMVHNIHPGKVLSAFIEVMQAIDKGSEEISENIHNN